MKKCIWLVCWLTVLFSGPSSAAVNDDLRLVEAARKQDSQEIHSLLKDKLNVNTAEADGTTALMWAVYWDDLEIVNLLIGSGADVNAENDFGVTSLNLASKNRNTAIVEALLKAGANPNLAMWSGETPLMTASRIGSIEIVELFLAHGADINHQEPRRHHSALMWAISFLHPEIARVLIEHKADLSAKTIKLKDGEYTPMLVEGYAEDVESVAQGGYTPLMFAARMGDMATARLLVDNGASVNDVSEADGSALVIATAAGYEDIALFLLEHGADPNISDANGMTALHYAMRDGLKRLHHYQNTAVKRICGFIVQGMPVCKPYDEVSEEEKSSLNDPTKGLSVVEPAKTFGRYDVLPGNNMHELAEALLAAGADVNAAMKYPPPRLRLEALPYLNLTGATPLLLASASLDSSAMEMFLEYGANPSVSTEVNRYFIKQTKDFYAQDNQPLGNGTILMVAAGLGRKKDFTTTEEQNALTAIKRLVGLGANVKAATATGWTALHAAAFLGADSLVKYLVEQGADINARNGCGRSPLSLAEGVDVTGLMDEPVPHEDTVKLLISLGTGKTASSSKNVGECVPGDNRLVLEKQQKEAIEKVKSQ